LSTLQGALSTDNAGEELMHPDFQRQVNELRRLDNFTNWFYLARDYLYLIGVIGAALTFYHGYSAWGFSWPSLIPVTLLAIVLVGVGQHRLVMLGHEASHFLLFKNARLNEIVANWFCFFPVWSVAYNYRLQHLAHHQYTNDPLRDPDFLYMEITGQRFNYPMPLRTFLWECVVKLLLWVPGLVANVLIRARMSNQGGSIDPYKAVRSASRWLPVIHLTYLVTLAALLAVAVIAGNILILVLAPLCLVPALFLFALWAPESWYMQTRVKPVIPHRWTLFQRHLFGTCLFVALAWLTFTTGHLWPLYYAVLWLVPLGTVFSYLMLLREEIQHSNTPSERFLDSRNCEGNVLLRWGLFPYQQGYHLPHHLFPLVPHYNLPKLDHLLRKTCVYRERAVVVRAL
jgi:fatty acid desaturase